jgi:hypothetical protein
MVNGPPQMYLFPTDYQPDKEVTGQVIKILKIMKIKTMKSLEQIKKNEVKSNSLLDSLFSQRLFKRSVTVSQAIEEDAQKLARNIVSDLNQGIALSAH